MLGSALHGRLHPAKRAWSQRANLFRHFGGCFCELLSHGGRHVEHSYAVGLKPDRLQKGIETAKKAKGIAPASYGRHEYDYRNMAQRNDVDGVLVATGVMNLPAMIALTAVVFLEKIWRHGAALGRLVGLALVLAACAAPWTPALLPGLPAGG